MSAQNLVIAFVLINHKLTPHVLSLILLSIFDTSAVIEVTIKINNPVELIFEC